MEFLLALAVITAVIIFGALISIGNERQRRAIDELREQVVLWAIQDLRIKREHLVRDVRVDDPVARLSGIASKVFGYDPKLQILEKYEEPQSISCTSADGKVKVMFSPLSPADLRRITNHKQSRLSQFAGHPLLSLPKGGSVHELSILNGDYLFDLELALAWKMLTGQNLESSNLLWMYSTVL